MTPPRNLRPLDSKIRARRIDTKKQLVVESKTIGTQMVYNLPMDNVSRSGLLLNMGRNRKVPFLVNTLLELTVDPQGAVFERPVICVGKIVRMQRDDDMKTQFGVQIVQIETKDGAMWDKVMDQLEGTHEDEVRYLPVA